MKNLYWITIFKRDFRSYFLNWPGYIILAVALFIDAFFFNTMALSNAGKNSEEILETFFYFSAGVHLVAAVFMSMKLLAEEKELKTLDVLLSSQASTWDIVIGKFISGAMFLFLLCILSSYMPILIYLNGKVTFAHIIAGYLGVWLFSCAGLAISLWCSSFSKTVMISTLYSALFIILLVLIRIFSSLLDEPMRSIMVYFDLFETHFRQSFQIGLIAIKDVVFFLSIIFIFISWTKINLDKLKL